MQPQRPTRAPALLVLRDSNFRTLWYIGGVIWTSWGIEILVLSWFILQETNDPFQVGLVLVFFMMPWLLFNLFSGALADRVNRQHILLLSQCLNVLVSTGLLLLIATDRIEPWHIFAALFLEGTARSLEFPSRRTAIYDMVGESRLVNAMSLEVMLNTTGRFLGPLIAGGLFSLLGFTGAYVPVLLLHLLALALLVRITIPQTQRVARTEPVLRSLVVALRYALHAPMLMAILYLSVIMNGLGFPVQQFVPVIGRDYLGLGPALVGVLVSAMPLGQFIGAVILALMKTPRRYGRVFVIGSLTFLAMALLFAWSPWFGLAFTLMTIGGAGTAGFDTMQSSITMVSSPQEMRGRMMGLMTTSIGLGILLGNLETGLVSTVIGTRWAISANTTAGLLAFVPALVLTPLLWQTFDQRAAETSLTQVPSDSSEMGK